MPPTYNTSIPPAPAGLHFLGVRLGEGVTGARHPGSLSMGPGQRLLRPALGMGALGRTAFWGGGGPFGMSSQGLPDAGQTVCLAFELGQVLGQAPFRRPPSPLFKLELELLTDPGPSSPTGGPETHISGATLGPTPWTPLSSLF